VGETIRSLGRSQMPPRRDPEASRVERRFTLATLVVATVFFAILFGLLKQFHVHWAAALVICLFLAVVGIAQMVVRDAETARLASVVVGSAVFLATYGVIFLMQGNASAADLLDPSTCVGCVMMGGLAGYTAGILMAGIFLVSNKVQHVLRRRSSTGSGESL
jgi:hypothetical protein